MKINDFFLGLSVHFLPDLIDLEHITGNMPRTRTNTLWSDSSWHFTCFLYCSFLGFNWNDWMLQEDVVYHTLFSRCGPNLTQIITTSSQLEDLIVYHLSCTQMNTKLLVPNWIWTSYPQVNKPSLSSPSVTFLGIIHSQYFVAETKNHWECKKRTYVALVLIWLLFKPFERHSWWQVVSPSR